MLERREPPFVLRFALLPLYSDLHGARDRLRDFLDRVELRLTEQAAVGPRTEQKPADTAMTFGFEWRTHGEQRVGFVTVDSVTGWRTPLPPPRVHVFGRDLARLDQLVAGNQCRTARPYAFNQAVERRSRDLFEAGRFAQV